MEVCWTLVDVAGGGMDGGGVVEDGGVNGGGGMDGGGVVEDGGDDIFH